MERIDTSTTWETSVFNGLLIKEEPPNAPPPQRDKFLNTYRMESTNFLCVGAGHTLLGFDINSYISKTTPTIFSIHEGVLTAMNEPHTRLDLIRRESPTQNSNYSPSLEVDRLIGGTCEVKMRTNIKHVVAKESSIIF
ncbi:unnamed protein product [Cochlearia groenlandica]